MMLIRMTIVELAKWRRQVLPYLAAAFIILVVMITAMSVVASSSKGDLRQGASRGFNGLAWSWTFGFKTAAIFGVLLGAFSVASESGQGTLRMALVRPVGRGAFFGGKAISLLVLTADLIVLVVGISVLTIGSSVGFGDVTDVTFRTKVLVPQAEMIQYTLKCLALCLAPLVCATLFGLFFSCCFENAGVAVAASVIIYLLLDTVSTRLPGAGRWIFTSYLGRRFELLRDLSNGIKVDLRNFREIGWDSGDVWIPVANAGVLLVGALWVFRRKDIDT